MQGLHMPTVEIGPFLISDMSHDTDQNVTYLIKRCPKKNGYLLTAKIPKAFQTSTEYFEADRFEKFYVREHNVVFEVTKIRRNGTVVRAQRIKAFVGHVTESHQLLLTEDV
ncbi:unnamed protein product [Clavelina lepadiformis]|uniref:Uncharacterized protein n=1 Tax=Clavelina lepadiformis TaxID=159417 RepID=A0ABP0GXH8_CLALP